MPTDFEELKRELLQTDEEYRQLATQHHDLDEKIHSLAARHYLSEPEQVEEVTAEEAQASPERSDGEHPPPAHGQTARRRTRRALTDPLSFRHRGPAAGASALALVTFTRSPSTLSP